MRASDDNDDWLGRRIDRRIRDKYIRMFFIISKSHS